MNKLSVQNLVRNYSIETTLRQAAGVARFNDIVASGTRVYIPHVPGTRLKDSVALARRLRAEAMEPVPHIVARSMPSRSVLDDFLARLSAEAGVVQALVVAGDSDVPAGEINSSLQILETGLLEKYRIRKIGVAGHPEGHPRVPDPILRNALARKKEYAQNTGATIYLVTQFVFSADPVTAWEHSYAADIGELPVTVGLPGLATARTLLKYAMECGVGPSMHAFSKHYASLTKLLTVSAPDRTIVALARHKERTPQSRIAGVHFFTFGGFNKTADWANRIVAGDFELTEDGLGLLS
jgi:methylenetetrahydrofolate reductase (NADPH)